MPEAPELVAGLPRYAAAAEAAAAEQGAPPILRLVPDGVDLADIEGVESVVAVSAGRHADELFEPWFVLWVFRANGHVLHAADYAGPEKGMDGLDPEVSVPMEVGQVVLLSAHRCHWLSASPSLLPASEWPWKKGDGPQPAVASLVRPHWFFAASFNVKRRPGRKEAEALLAKRCLPAADPRTGEAHLDRKRV